MRGWWMGCFWLAGGWLSGLAGRLGRSEDSAARSYRFLRNGVILWKSSQLRFHTTPPLLIKLSSTRKIQLTSGLGCIAQRSRFSCKRNAIRRLIRDDKTGRSHPSLHAKPIPTRLSEAHRMAFGVQRLRRSVPMAPIRYNASNEGTAPAAENR